MNHQGWLPLELIDLISLQSKGLSKVFSNTAVQKHQFFGAQPSLSNSHIHTWLLKNHSFDYIDLCWQSNVSAFNMLSIVGDSFSSKEQASFNFMAEVTICSDSEAQKNSLSLFPLFPHLFAMKWWHWMPWSLIFECWVLSQLFHALFSPSSRDSLVPLRFLP